MSTSDTVYVPAPRSARFRRGHDTTLAESFDRDGFAVLDRVLDPAQLDEVRAEALAICRGDRGAVDGLQPADPDEPAADTFRRYLAIHMPHKISARMRDVARTPTAVAALTSVIGPNVKMMQSMLFIKAEGKPGQAWHQDETFIPTRDRSLAAIWIALDDATVENGCLWVIPGSHRMGVLYPDREQDDARFDCTRESYGFGYREEDAVAMELPAGSALMFDGYLLHRSLPNTGAHGTRRALVNHYMSAESLLPWFRPDGDQGMGRTDHCDILMVAGDDPYEFKGTPDIMGAHIRPEKQGGCIF